MASPTEAWTAFEQLGTPLWAARIRAEMDGVAGLAIDTRRHQLTPSEQKVARLTKSGMTDGEVASILVVSPKTIEFHLGGIYRKWASGHGPNPALTCASLDSLH